ncbi:hypothetical protein [Microbacterium cremeum]|uniref:hypothetical protein n=1 Tax=Microbacterium cremeum TaxID=2782169 RepID=UPI0018880610|nr:hypothetical protein [Microbacterium cremeum]
MGFSPLGLVVALCVLAPTLLLVWFPPQVPVPAAHVPRALGLLERAGQALCVVVPAITLPGRLIGWWAVPAVVALVGYYALWARYLLDGRTATALYRPWWVLPVPMAILPVLVILSTAAWLSNPWIAVAGVILAAGHIPASVIIARAVQAGAQDVP